MSWSSQSSTLSYGRAYYLNQSFFIREALAEPFPPSVDGHIRGRAKGLIPGAQELADLLDHDHDLWDDERRERLRALIVAKQSSGSVG
jgi:hypothetical protein